MIRTVILSLLCWACAVANLTESIAESTIVEYEPFTALKRSRLVGLFPFDNDNNNVVPLTSESTSSRYLKELLYPKFASFHPLLFQMHRLLADASSAKRSSDAVQKWSVFLSGNSNISIPISIAPVQLPVLTVGAWVKPTAPEEGWSEQT